jgi:hypothetical protein
MAFIGLQAELGLNTSTFSQRLNAAQGDAKNVKRDWGDFKDLVGAAGFGAAAISFFNFAIEGARNSKDATDKNAEAVRNFADGLDGMKSKAQGLAVALVGGLNRLGEAAGEYYGNMLGLNDATAENVALVESTAKAAAEAERSLAESKKHAEEFKAITKQLADIDAKREEQRFKALTDQERMNELENKLMEINRAKQQWNLSAIEQRRLELQYSQTSLALEAERTAYFKKQTEASEKAKEAEHAAYMQTLDSQKKIAVLNREIAMLQSAINNSVTSEADKQRLIERLKARQVELGKENAAVTKEQRKQVEELEKASRLSGNEQLELFVLEYKGLTALTEQERVRYDQLKLMEKEKKLQVKIDELASKGVENLTAEEKARLAQLMFQKGVLDEQIQALMEILGLINKVNVASGVVTKELDKQKQILVEQGSMYLMGGIRNYNTPTDQQSYENQLLETARRDTEQAIKTWEAKIEAYQRNGSSFGQYEIYALQQMVAGYKSRLSNLRDYVFNPNYSDAAGQGIFASQVSTIGDPLGLQNKSDSSLGTIASGISDINDRLRQAGFPKN